MLQRRLCRKRSQTAAVKLGVRFALNPMCTAYVQLLINFYNQFVDGESGCKLPVVDPRIGETILEVEEGDTADVDRAVHAASEAFNEGPWPKTAAQVSWCG